MAEKNGSEEEGRKSARAKKAVMRDEDVVSETSPEERDVKKVKAGASRRGGEEQPKAEDKSDTKEAPKAKQETKAKQEPKKPTIDPIEGGKAWLSTLFEKMHLELDVAAKKEGNNYVFNVTGSDASDLVGRSRQSPRLLTSMQSLLSEYLGRDTSGRVVVDIGGFQQKRQSRLISIADQLGEAVKTTGRSLKIAGLNSYERRVVHQHLTEIDTLDTASIDHGIFRKLQIVPNE